MNHSSHRPAYPRKNRLMSTTVCNTPPVASVETNSQRSANSSKGKSTYGEILKSTAWVGGSQAVSIVIGIVRTKAMAILLGPAGFGLAGLYMSVASLTQSVAGLGVNSSGVRQIAEAVGTEDERRISQTAAVLSRVSFGLGILGALLLAVFSVPMSVVTFGTSERWFEVCLLGIVVALTLVSAGQGALIQGMRRIADLAKMNVLGAFLGTLAAIPLVYLYGRDGIVPSLIVTAAAGLALSWWYSRKIGVRRSSISMAELRTETAPLLKLGVAFMISNLLMMLSAYVVRILIRQKVGLEATGFYHAAWTIGGLYVGMILQAMGADFYPRLTAVINDHVSCNRLVNEQARISLLLAGPGVIATLTLAPLALSMMYAPEFGGAVNLLRWICLGVAMRVISWPMGYIIMAKARQNIIILCEMCWTVVHLGLAWIFVGKFGADGAGMAFFGSYVFHIAMTYVTVRKLAGFRWSVENFRTIVAYVLAVLCVFAGFGVLPLQFALGFGVFITALNGILSVRALLTVLGKDQIIAPISRFFIRPGMATSKADPIR